MVVVPDERTTELRRSRAAYEVLWGTGVASDVLVWTTGQFNCRVHLAASLPATSFARAHYCMPHDPSLVAEVRAWLSKGGKDLAAAEYELRPPRRSPTTSSFTLSRRLRNP